MSSVKGWEGKVKYSNRVVFEAVATGSGGAAQSYDLDYECDDEFGVITDDENDIAVYLDGVLQDTGGTVYTLDGDGGAGGVGRLTFPGSHDGVVIEASYYTYQTIGYVQSVGVSVGNNVEPLFELGSREPVELKEGNIDISLDMTRSFIDLSLVDTVSFEHTEAEKWLASELFDLEVYPKGDTSGDPIMTVRGKFNNYDLDMAQDGVLMDSVNFIGQTITPSTV